MKMMNSKLRCGMSVLLAAMMFGAMALVAPSVSAAPREVTFPPPDSKPPPPHKSPPRTKAAGEETSLLPDYGPTMSKDQERQPPPPTNLTVMYKVQYGEKLAYTHPDGTKQEFEQWESFKSDGFNLIKYTNERLMDGNNYQYAIQPLASPGFDPVDIPILYMTGDYDFAFRDAEVENLRKFLLDGGTIIFNAARGRDEFTRSVIQQMQRVFPQKPFMKLSLDHPIYNGKYRISDVSVMINGVTSSKAPEVYSMDIGTRAAVILIPDGMGTAWSGEKYHPGGKHLMGESAIRMGVNLVAYVLGSTEYGRFMAQEFPVYNGQTKPGDVPRFAQVKYAGAWDVNPTIQNSVMQGLKDNTDIDVDFTPYPIELSDAQIGSYPLLFMTGHYDFKFNDEEIKNLRAYLLKGGTLFATAAAGLKPFDVGFKREMKRVLPDAELVRIPPSHPLFAYGWNVMTSVEYTASALRDDPTLQYPEFYGIFVDKRLVVLYTPFDLLSGVNRESNAYAKGLTSDDALRVSINCITYVMSH